MTHKIIALLVSLLMMLSVLPALAEAAATADAAPVQPLQPFAPTPEDFLGEWTLLYVISGGVISPDAAQNAADALVIGEECMYGRHGKEQSPLYPYEISGNTLKADATVCTLAAYDLLLVEAEDLGTLVYQRTLRPDNPFIGDWQVILITGGGILDCRDIENAPVFRFGDFSVTLISGPYEETLPCTYQNNTCIVALDGNSFTFAIDANGLMTMWTETYGVNALLLRVQ